MTLFLQRTTKHLALLLFYYWYILARWNVRKSGWKNNMSSVTPLRIIQTQKGISFRTCRLDFMPTVVWFRPPPWQGTLKCFSAVLQQSVGSQQQSAEITEKRWSSRYAELSICKIQCAEVAWGVGGGGGSVEGGSWPRSLPWSLMAGQTSLGSKERGWGGRRGACWCKMDARHLRMSYLKL